MKALQWARRAAARVSLSQKPLPEPEAVNAQPRNRTGFFAGLTAEQKRMALDYRGPENHGDIEFRRNRPAKA